MTKQEKVEAFMGEQGFVYITPKYTPKSASWRGNGLNFTNDQATFFYDVVEQAQNEVIEWLESDLKRLDSRNWTMETMVLDHLVGSGKADECQKSKRQEIVEDRRAAHALYAILANYKKRHLKQEGKTNG